MCKYILPLLLLTILIVGCETEKPLPLEEEKLVKILCDIHMAEAALKKLNGTIKDSAAVKLYKQIYAIHEVSGADVDSCLYYLKRNPESMKVIYEQVMTELEKMKLLEQSDQ